MANNINPKKLALTATKEVISLPTTIYNALSCKKVLDVPTCSPLFKDSVKFSSLRQLEKETTKKSDLEEITYQKKKIIKSYNNKQLDKMKEIIKHIESNN